MKTFRSKKKLSRREFLMTTAGAAGALVLAGAVGAPTARARKKATRRKGTRKKATRKKASLRSDPDQALVT
jgi:spermidine/putrescine-binding protein